MSKKIYKEKVKESKGITLIALVITIIVLLILAGVAIATLTGDNGIIQNAKVAKTSTEEKAVEEEVELIIIEAKTDLIEEGKKLTIQAISEQIKKKKDEQIEMIIRYMPTAQVEIIEDEIIGEGGIIGQIHHAEIEYKGYRFILNGDLEISREETKRIDTIKKSNVTYNLNGGEGKFPTQELETGRRLPKEEPTKQGYGFIGWNTKEDGSRKNIYSRRYI